MYLLILGKLCSLVGMAVGTRVVFDATSASQLRDLASSSPRLPISTQDRLAKGVLRIFLWTDARNVLADGLAKFSFDTALFDATC